MGWLHRAFWYRRADWRGYGDLPGGSSCTEKGCDGRTHRARTARGGDGRCASAITPQGNDRFDSGRRSAPVDVVKPSRRGVYETPRNPGSRGHGVFALACSDRDPGDLYVASRMGDQAQASLALTGREWSAGSPPIWKGVLPPLHQRTRNPVVFI